MGSLSFRTGLLRLSHVACNMHFILVLVTCLGLFSEWWDLFHLSLFLSRMISIVPFSAHTLPCSTRSSFWSVHCSVWSLLGKALWSLTTLMGLQPFTGLYLMQQIWNSHPQMNLLSIMRIKSSKNIFFLPLQCQNKMLLFY